jgi:hypothetical protein
MLKLIDRQPSNAVESAAVPYPTVDDQPGLPDGLFSNQKWQFG